MKFRNTAARAEKLEPQMAPMIDVVFQLLIFFMLTLKIIEPEGDFSINMPQGKPAPDVKNEAVIDPLLVRLNANPDGTLRSLQIGPDPESALRPVPATNEQAVRDYMKLNEKEQLSYSQAAMRLGEERLFEMLNDKAKEHRLEAVKRQPDKKKLEEQLKAKIEFDYNLNHRYLIEATSACRGEVVEGGKKPPKELIKNIEFVRPARPEKQKTTGGA